MTKHTCAGLLILIALLSVLALSACNGKDSDAGTELTLSRSSEFRGTRQLPPLRLPDGTLTDTDGQPYPLRDQAAGKVTLLYLGIHPLP